MDMFALHMNWYAHADVIIQCQNLSPLPTDAFICIYLFIEINYTVLWMYNKTDQLDFKMASIISNGRYSPSTLSSA